MYSHFSKLWHMREASNSREFLHESFSLLFNNFFLTFPFQPQIFEVVVAFPRVAFVQYWDPQYAVIHKCTSYCLWSENKSLLIAIRYPSIISSSWGLQTYQTWNPLWPSGNSNISPVKVLTHCFTPRNSCEEIFTLNQLQVFGRKASLYWIAS